MIVPTVFFCYQNFQILIHSLKYIKVQTSQNYFSENDIWIIIKQSHWQLINRCSHCFNTHFITCLFALDLPTASASLSSEETMLGLLSLAFEEILSLASQSFRVILWSLSFIRYSLVTLISVLWFHDIHIWSFSNHGIIVYENKDESLYKNWPVQKKLYSHADHFHHCSWSIHCLFLQLMLDLMCIPFLCVRAAYFAGFIQSSLIKPKSDMRHEVRKIAIKLLFSMTWQTECLKEYYES